MKNKNRWKGRIEGKGRSPHHPSPNHSITDPTHMNGGCEGGGWGKKGGRGKDAWPKMGHPQILSAVAGSSSHGVSPGHAARSPLVCGFGCTPCNETQHICHQILLVSCTACMLLCPAQPMLLAPADWPFYALTGAACHEQDLHCPNAPLTLSFAMALDMLVGYDRILGRSTSANIWPSKL